VVKFKILRYEKDDKYLNNMINASDVYSLQIINKKEMKK
jgi:hypothetical protein